MKSLILALFAVALQVAAAAETGTFVCKKDGSKLTITGADPSEKLMYVKGKATDVNCKADINAGTGNLDFKYTNCGVQKPTGAGNVEITFFATVLSDGTNSGPPDTKHTYKCTYDANGEPILSGSSTSNVTATENFDDVIAKQSIPALTLKIIDDADDTKIYSTTNTVAAGTKVKLRVTFDDAAGTYAGLAKIVNAWYKSGATKSLQVIKTGCTTGEETSAKNAAQKTGVKASNTITTDSTTLKMVMFAPPLPATVTVEVELAICVTANDPTCQPVQNCNLKRRRRDVHQGNVIFAHANFTLSVKKENNEKKTDLQPLCAGYTSNTVFYMVVFVLAVLLVITIGVAAYFGAQAKKQVSLTGKDNPVYT